MAGQPYMQFYVGDWKREPSLAKCTALGRAVWLELLLAMHDDEASKVSGKTWQLALVCRLPQDQFESGLEELRANGVCDISVTDNGDVTVMSRRRAREEESRQRGRERQKRHRERQAQKAESQRCNAKTPSEDEYDSEDDSENESVLETRARSFSARETEVIYKSYPRLVGKRRALGEIERALKRIASGESGPDPPPDDPVAWLRQRTQAYAKARKGEPKKFTPHPSTWYSQDRFDDNDNEWKTDSTSRGSDEGNSVAERYADPIAAAA